MKSMKDLAFHSLECIIPIRLLRETNCDFLIDLAPHRLLYRKMHAMDKRNRSQSAAISSDARLAGAMWTHQRTTADHTRRRIKSERKQNQTNDTSEPTAIIVCICIIPLKSLLLAELTIEREGGSLTRLENANKRIGTITD